MKKMILLLFGVVVSGSLLGGKFEPPVEIVNKAINALADDTKVELRELTGLDKTRYRTVNFFDIDMLKNPVNGISWISLTQQKKDPKQDLKIYIKDAIGAYYEIDLTKIDNNDLEGPAEMLRQKIRGLIDK